MMHRETPRAREMIGKGLYNVVLEKGNSDNVRMDRALKAGIIQEEERAKSRMARHNSETNDQFDCKASRKE